MTRKAYEVRPITRNAATAWIRDVHRHLKRPVAGRLFGVEILEGVTRIGVACAARPSARLLQDGMTVEIRRVAVVDGYPNACSFAYGALRRAAVAIGYTDVITYTRADESGVSLRAAGFICEGAAGGGEASRPSRPRQPSEDPSPKVRWRWSTRQAAEAA